MLKPLHDPANGPLRVAGFMSGSGTNLRRILEFERERRRRGERPSFEVVVIFSDNAQSQAAAIGADFDLPVVIRDLAGYYRARGLPRKDMKAREQFDAETVRALAPFAVKAVAYAGYMSIATRPLIDAWLGVNVHPADLSIERDGRRVFVGAHAVRDAIQAGEAMIASTTHIVEAVVDGGRLLMISPPLPVEWPAGTRPGDAAALAAVADHNQERLKRAGDWVIFPRTLHFIGLGRFAQDEQGRLYFDGEPTPKGHKIEKTEI